MQVSNVHRWNQQRTRLIHELWCQLSFTNFSYLNCFTIPGAADGAWLNIGIFCLVFVQFILAILFLILLGITIYCLGCVLGFIASVFGAIFQEEVTWIGNNFKPLDVKIPNIDVRISDYTCFIIIVVLEILIASGLHLFCFRKFFISFKSLKTTESETFRQFGTDVSCWLLYYIQTPELLIHTFNYKNNLVDLNFRRLFVDLFFWIPMNAFVIFVTVWILIAAFLRCFKTKASTK